MIECSSILKDVEGKPWAVQAAGQPFVYFDYNPVGDNTKVYSSQPNDWERDYTYDMLGRRLTYMEGELAESITYNGGNLSTHTQNWMENGITQSRTTTYHYNAHRLDSVSYDDALTTIYHYDQYGRVDSLYDESGVMCYEYGNMGEVTRETRIYALPFLTSALALSTQFGYDSWGRVDSIVYPDNETVKYRYGCGGQLQGICSRQVPAYTYLDSVLYDRFGAKVSQKYGNGLKTTYSYNSLTRRLSNIATMDGGSQVSSFAYTYDPVGNVTHVTSTCPWLNSQTFTETFTYDASDQLTAAEETQSRSYRLDVTYGDWGRVSDYALTRTDMQDNSSTSDAHTFCYPTDLSVQPQCQTLFAPEMSNGTSDVTYSFGINGSLRKREVQSPNSYTEHYLFNSAANLKAYSCDALDFAYYGYNASNTRAYKLSMLNTNQWVNGEPQPIQLQKQQAMFYPNAYLNFNHNGEYTKHYYNGTERIASRLGDNQQTIEAEANDRLQSRIAQIDELFKAQISEMAPYEEPAVNVPGRSSGEGTRNLLFPSVDYDPIPAFTDLQPTGNATDIFYYHTNHLGSTDFVTDQNQNVTQGFLYAPFGEITTEYNANFYNNVLPKYSFNAKELDEETGMYYYEARYYKPPVFTSRDPMFEKYFWMTPYAYCANNPVKYVDPSGEEYGDYYDKNRKWVFNDGRNDGKIYVEDQENGVFMGPLVQPLYREVGTVTSVELTYTGEATSQSENTDVCKAEGTLSVIQHCDDGNSYERFSLSATSGPYGNGSLENGSYTVKKGWIRNELGYKQHGFGFCFPIIPDFLTGRNQLLIHPDGNKPGTKGCIGITAGLSVLKDFYNTMNRYIKNYGNLPLTVDINENVNNNGGTSNQSKENE